MASVWHQYGISLRKAKEVRGEVGDFLTGKHGGKIPLRTQKNPWKRPDLTEKVCKIICNYYKNRYLCNGFLEKLP